MAFRIEQSTKRQRQSFTAKRIRGEINHPVLFQKSNLFRERVSRFGTFNPFSLILPKKQVRIFIEWTMTFAFKVKALTL